MPSGHGASSEGPRQQDLAEIAAIGARRGGRGRGAAPGVTSRRSTNASAGPGTPKLFR